MVSFCSCGELCVSNKLVSERNRASMAARQGRENTIYDSFRSAVRLQWYFHMTSTKRMTKEKLQRYCVVTTAESRKCNTPLFLTST